MANTKWGKSLSALYQMGKRTVDKPDLVPIGHGDYPIGESEMSSGKTYHDKMTKAHPPSRSGDATNQKTSKWSR